MSKRNEMLRRAVVAVGGAAALGLLAVSIGAVAGVIDAERQREAAPVVKKASPVLLLRCWQEGRLLFEEPLSSVPAETRKNARITVQDREGRALQVIDMASATCLVRSTPAEEYRSEGGAAR
jgi:hypothetical protein